MSKKTPRSGVNETLTAFCRTCRALIRDDESTCLRCGSRRLSRHPELGRLAIAHVDCDAFYASIEKRDDPALADQPVIIGGGARGVVSTCCYVARTYGVKSAMPMFKALAACPQAVVIRPNMRKYGEAARQIRNMMENLTPLVEPLSIDEAFLDLQGTERIHAMTPAQSISRLQEDIKRDVGVTVSVGLSYNKFLAKVASDLDKPDGFSVIGRAEAATFLARQSVRAIWGVGPSMADRLARDGFVLIGDLQQADAANLARRYGELGLRLARLARGEDSRDVDPHRRTKSVSAETTFDKDIRELAGLEDALWPLCEKISRRMKEKTLLGRTVVLKLKSADFRLLTRQTRIERPSNFARAAFAAARPMLHEAAAGRAWRLIGVGYGDLCQASQTTQQEMFNTPDSRIADQERAIDEIRRRFGDGAIGAGRGLRRGED